MSTDRFILTAAERPGWLEYPASFQQVVQQCLVHMTPWHLLEADRATRHFQGLATRYPSRELLASKECRVGLVVYNRVGDSPVHAGHGGWSH